MSDVYPATLHYDIAVDGTETLQEQVVRFNGVMTEGHGASSTISKYPSQRGFSVTEHAIRGNNTLELRVMFSNTLLKDSTNSFKYSEQNNTREVFKILRGLVNDSTVVKAKTNLGDYEEVLFTSFYTETAEERTDSIEVVMKGEELIRDVDYGSVAPKPLRFIEVNPKDFWPLEWGEYVEGVRLENAEVVLGESFTITDYNAAGSLKTTTYEFVGDASQGEHSYKISKEVDDSKSTVQEAGVFNLAALGSDVSSAATKAGGNCLLTSAVDLASEKLEDSVASITDGVDESILGIGKTLTKMGGGSELAELASGCAIVAGRASVKTGINSFIAVKTDAEQVAERERANAGLPTVADSLDSAFNSGSAATSKKTMSITKTINQMWD